MKNEEVKLNNDSIYIKRKSFCKRWNIIEQEIDYLIYLTGSFIRLILQIEESKKEVKE